MIKELNIVLTARDASNEDIYKPILANKLNIPEKDINGIILLRRSIDARQRNVKLNLLYRVFINEEISNIKTHFTYQDVSSKEPVIVVGAGPAGLFAALKLIEEGYKPIIVERGKTVNDRKKDLSTIHRERLIDPDSNYSFGEGGAGTFSDGKLYTRSKKRGDVKKILEIFHFHGAQDDVLIDAHPHIGSNVLPKVIINIRKSILQAGGEMLFNTKMTDLIIEDDKIKGIQVNNSENIMAEAVILATGHSARDIYYLFEKKNISIEAKAFAMGVRIEHSQHLVDQLQYHNPKGRGEFLPPASYSFVSQVDKRGVYSFCMCPGGIIVPSASDSKQQVVNGMSASKRNTPFANSGMAVQILPEDIPEYDKYGPLACLQYQIDLEEKAFEMGGENLTAPAQRMLDFTKGIVSNSLPKSSYTLGMKSSPMHEWLPKHIGKRLQKAFVEFGRKSKGFLTNEAVILGVESRTSSPVRIPRNRDNMQHVHVSGLYPCGEGAGYAGGIVSAAIDGAACVDAFVKNK